jgi:hypothetical protein
MASPPRKARRSADEAGEFGDGQSTRTSSRSAKRRSPKEPEPDPELLELERTQFLRAMDRYKRKTGKTFPSWSEVLEVLRDLGWVSPAKLEAERRDEEPVA